MHVGLRDPRGRRAARSLPAADGHRGQSSGGNQAGGPGSQRGEEHTILKYLLKVSYYTIFRHNRSQIYQNNMSLKCLARTTKQITHSSLISLCFSPVTKVLILGP